MRTLVNIIYATILLTNLSCSNNEKTIDGNSEIISIEDTSDIEKPAEGNPIDYDKTKVLQKVYVVDRDGAKIKQDPNENSKTLGVYEYGTLLEVIEITDTWLGVRDRIGRDFLSKNGDEIQISRWEKVYISKRTTGNIEQIELDSSDLNVISNMIINQKTESFELDKELTDFLKIELIDKQLYDRMKKSKADFLLADTSKIKKRNGVIELKCENAIKKYVDKIDDNDETSVEIFNYIGQFENLNKYLISGSYYENWDFRLVDKKSGLEIQKLVAFPNISKDQKHIICVSADPYETNADVELYSINDKQVTPVVSVSYKYWMPMDDPKDIFWGTDGFFYLRANHVNSFWNADGSLNESSQYIRIKIL